MQQEYTRQGTIEAWRVFRARARQLGFSVDEHLNGMSAEERLAELALDEVVAALPPKARVDVLHRSRGLAQPST
jgi:hypothetical protein